MSLVVPEYISINKACKELKCDLEDLIHYLESGQLDVFMVNPVEIRMFPPSEIDVSTGEQLRDAAGTIIAKKISRYCQIKSLRQIVYGTFVYEQALILSADGGIAEIIDCRGVARIDDLWIKNPAFRNRRIDALDAEIDSIIKSGTPPNTESIWRELELRCGRGCCLNVEFVNQTDKEPQIAWKGRNGTVRHLTKNALAERLRRLKKR